MYIKIFIIGALVIQPAHGMDNSKVNALTWCSQNYPVLTGVTLVAVPLAAGWLITKPSRDKQYQIDLKNILEYSIDPEKLAKAYREAVDKTPLIRRSCLAAQVGNHEMVSLCFDAGVKPTDIWRSHEFDTNNLHSPFWTSLCHKKLLITFLCTQRGASAVTLVDGIPALTRMFNNRNIESVKALVRWSKEDILPAFQHPTFEWGWGGAQLVARMLPFLAQYVRGDTIRLFKSKGISLLELDEEGFTAVHRAAQYGNNDVLIELIQNNKKITEYRSVGWLTPVMIAASNGHEKSVELLWSKKDFRVIDERSRTALDHAMLAGHFSIMRKIVELIKRDQPTIVMSDLFDSMGVLQELLSREYYICAQFQLEQGVRVTQTDALKNLPLHVAAFKKNCPIELVKLLIEKTKEKGMINKRNGLKLTALDIALVSGSEEVQQLLIQAGAQAPRKLHSSSYLEEYAYN